MVVFGTFELKNGTRTSGYDTLAVLILSSYCKIVEIKASYLHILTNHSNNKYV